MLVHSKGPVTNYGGGGGLQNGSGGRGEAVLPQLKVLSMRKREGAQQVLG